MNRFGTLDHEWPSVETVDNRIGSRMANPGTDTDLQCYLSMLLYVENYF